jgi:hypothetical protein
MGWGVEAFRENMNLEHTESVRIFQFMLKAVAAMAYIYVLGYFAAGGGMSPIVWAIILIGAVFDLVPELMTMRSVHLLPERAQRAEKTQLGLTAFAYILLAATLFASNGMPVFTGYVAFAVLWIIAFLVQEAVFLHLEETGDI